MFEVREEELLDPGLTLNTSILVPFQLALSHMFKPMHDDDDEKRYKLFFSL